MYDEVAPRVDEFAARLQDVDAGDRALIDIRERRSLGRLGDEDDPRCAGGHDHILVEDEADGALADFHEVHEARGGDDLDDVNPRSAVLIDLP